MRLQILMQTTKKSHIMELLLAALLSLTMSGTPDMTTTDDKSQTTQVNDGSAERGTVVNTNGNM
ncbi:MAG: hypothetical protein IPJ79_03150 [Bacteroidetes bacterium]|nr:hypothetical protein [Bacteroidota bacterium]